LKDLPSLIKDEVLLTVSCPIFPSILIAKNLLTGSLKKRSIDNLETQKKSISMKKSQFAVIVLQQPSEYLLKVCDLTIIVDSLRHVLHC
jgi:hypothetical protein